MIITSDSLLHNPIVVNSNTEEKIAVGTLVIQLGCGGLFYFGFLMMETGSENMKILGLSLTLGAIVSAILLVWEHCKQNAWAESIAFVLGPLCGLGLSFFVFTLSPIGPLVISETGENLMLVHRDLLLIGALAGALAGSIFSSLRMANHILTTDKHSENEKRFNRFGIPRWIRLTVCILSIFPTLYLSILFY